MYSLQQQVTASLLCIMVLLASACGKEPETPEETDLMALYREVLNHPERPEQDRARDASSLPLESLSLMGVRPGMSILDFHSAGGYFTELLSRIVGPEGKVYAHVHPGNGILAPEVFEQRYGNQRLLNVERLVTKHNDLVMPEASLDAILLSMVYHDTYWHSETVDWGPIDQQALLAEFRKALKPDGVILVIDHKAESGSDPYETAVASHRIDPAIVLRDFTLAGFNLLAESEALHNPDDDFVTGIFDPAIYRQTERFMFLFGRP